MGDLDLGELLIYKTSSQPVTEALSRPLLSLTLVYSAALVVSPAVPGPSSAACSIRT